MATPSLIAPPVGSTSRQFRKVILKEVPISCHVFGAGSSGLMGLWEAALDDPIVKQGFKLGGIETVTVDESNDGAFVVSVYGRDVTYNAVGKTKEEIRDAIVAALVADTYVALMPVRIAADAIDTDEFTVTGYDGQPVHVAVSGDLSVETTQDGVRMGIADIGTIRHLTTSFDSAFVEHTQMDVIGTWTKTNFYSDRNALLRATGDADIGSINELFDSDDGAPV